MFKPYEKPYYFRKESYLYKLKSHESYNFCVGSSKKIQAFWGWHDNFICLLLFNPRGDLIEIKEVYFNEFISNFEFIEKISKGLKTENITVNLNVYELIFDEATQYFKEEYKLNEDLISVKRFWIPKYVLGIEDITDCPKEFLLNPSKFYLDEHEELRECVEWWKDSGQYALWWGQSYYVSEDGNVNTS